MELIVTDWGSTDSNPTAWLHKALSNTNIDLTVAQLTGTFSRGRGLNVAASLARYPNLFFIDTDMLIGSNILRDAVQISQAGAAYFPICYSYRDANQSKGYWREAGHGIVALSRALYERAHKWDEITQWGSEDVKFHERVSKLATVVRKRCDGLYHQWHTPSRT